MSRLWREPVPIEVESAADQPAVLHLNGQRHRIQSIENHWRVDERWRDGPARDYFLVVTDRDLWAIIYRDLIAQVWFLQGIYD